MIRIKTLAGDALDGALDDLAKFRITVFREFPYLYDGSLTYERTYLDSFRRSQDAVIVGAYDDDQLIGAATAAPLSDHKGDFATAFDNSGLDVETVYYCAESVLLPQYRGQGIGHHFFDERERVARKRGFTSVAFCSVVRRADHPLRPANYRSLDTFWRGRGYAPLPGVIASFDWKDVDQPAETSKLMQFWLRHL